MKTIFMMFLSNFNKLAIKYDNGTVIEVNTVEELAQIARTFCADKRLSDMLLNGDISFTQAARRMCASIIIAGDSNVYSNVLVEIGCVPRYEAFLKQW